MKKLFAYALVVIFSPIIISGFILKMMLLAFQTGILIAKKFNVWIIK